MSDAVSVRCKTNLWSVLLEETRVALAHLRAEDLEDLAARAQCMLDATTEWSLIRQPIAAPKPLELAELGREQHLLGGLLDATQANLRILGRATGEDSLRWVR